MEKIIPIRIDRIAHDGAAEGRHGSASVRVFGMLPDEEGIVEIERRRKLYVGTLKELTHASARRKTPDELHYLSCSPWQVMEYPLQAELKHALLAELFGYHADAPKPLFRTAEQFYGYRTKIEFSFCDRAMSEEVLRPAGRTHDRAGDQVLPLSLAFHERGGGSKRLPLPQGCMLASERMNAAALRIVERLREAGLIARDLKTLVLRESKSAGKLIALLYAKKEEIPRIVVEDIPDLAGFIVFHSSEKSPASIVTKELWRYGASELTEHVAEMRMRYSWDSFFQNNIPMFEAAMRAISEEIAGGERVLELYAGVGTIGLLLAKCAKSVHGIEVVSAATAFAKKNAEANGITNYVAECIPAEKMDAKLFAGKDVLVLDPPRAGLHPKVITMITEALPKKIVYLSCNPETQARDYSALRERYVISKIEGYDFYPQTPHMESLIVLNLRTK